MVNEKRVKHMVKLAFYEQKGGSEEIKITARSKNDYIKRNVWSSVLCMTLAFLLILCFLFAGVFYSSFLEINITQLLILVVGAIISYFALCIIVVTKAKDFYEKKYTKAQRHVQQFEADLAELEYMYDEEEQNGENI